MVLGISLFSARNFVPYDVVRCRNIWYIYNILVQRHPNGVKIWTGSGNFAAGIMIESVMNYYVLPKFLMKI